MRTVLSVSPRSGESASLTPCPTPHFSVQLLTPRTLDEFTLVVFQSFKEDASIETPPTLRRIPAWILRPQSGSVGSLDGDLERFGRMRAYI